MLNKWQEYERAVIFRLGRLLTGGARGPGEIFSSVIGFLLVHQIMLRDNYLYRKVSLSLGDDPYRSFIIQMCHQIILTDHQKVCSSSSPALTCTRRSTWELQHTRSLHRRWAWIILLSLWWWRWWWWWCCWEPQHTRSLHRRWAWSFVVVIVMTCWWGPWWSFWWMLWWWQSCFDVSLMMMSI